MTRESQADSERKVSAIVPARNEARNIGPVLAGALLHSDEVIVVDGHSSDDTVAIAERAGVRVVFDNGRGKGDALRVGAQAASHGIVVFIDADGSHDPADIPKLAAPIRAGRADLVVGSRGRGGSDELHGDLEKFLRMVGSDIILLGINYRFGVRLTDSQNGFRAIKREVMLGLGTVECLTTIEQEMTMKALKRGYVVTEVPTHEYARAHGRSSIRLRRVALRYVYSWLKNLL